MAKKNRSPAFQLYAADFLASEKVVLMELDEVGAYIVLLCNEWLRGSIPADRTSIAALLKKKDGPNGTADGDLMARLMAMVSKCFELKKNEPGRLINARLESERRKQKDHLAKQSANGRKGAKAKWGKRVTSDGDPNGTAMISPLAKNGSSSSSSSSSLPPNPQRGNEGEGAAKFDLSDPKIAAILATPIRRPT